MTYLADANVLSEGMKRAPLPQVEAWLEANESEIVVDPIVLGQVQVGIEILPAGARKRRLEQWFVRGVSRLRCVPWDRETGMRWARLVGELRRRGESMRVKDSMIAATALRYGLVVATRNVVDFQKARVRVVNPFE